MSHQVRGCKMTATDFEPTRKTSAKGAYMQSGISTDKWSGRLRWPGALSGPLLVFVGRQGWKSSLNQNEGPDRIVTARRSLRVGSIREKRDAIGGIMQTGGHFGS